MLMISCTTLWCIYLLLYYFTVISQEVNKTHSRVCMRDSIGYKGQRNDVIVNYLVIGGDYGKKKFICVMHQYLSKIVMRNQIRK